MQHACGDLLNSRLNVNVLPVDVVPCATDEEVDVMRQVEDDGDKSQTAQKEEDAICKGEDMKLAS